GSERVSGAHSKRVCGGNLHRRGGRFGKTSEPPAADHAAGDGTVAEKWIWRPAIPGVEPQVIGTGNDQHWGIEFCLATKGCGGVAGKFAAADDAGLCLAESGYSVDAGFAEPGADF